MPYLCSCLRHVLFAALYLSPLVTSLPMHYFFNPPFSNGSFPLGTETFPSGSDTHMLKLKTPILLNRRPNRRIYIMRDGFITFARPGDNVNFTPRTKAQADDFIRSVVKRPMLAVFLADFDFQPSGGTIQYRIIKRGNNNCRDRKLISRIEKEIRALFGTKYTTFVAKQIVVVSWNRMIYKLQDAARATPNTFELALITDGGQSFAVFNYNETDTESARKNGGPEVWAGVFPSRRRNVGQQFKLPNFFTQTTNMATPGMWIARLTDLLDSSYSQPQTGGIRDVLNDIRRTEGFESHAFTACRPKRSICGGTLKCDPNAECQRSGGGSCCRCKTDYYGAGEVCANAYPEDTRSLIKGKILVDGKSIDCDVSIDTSGYFTKILSGAPSNKYNFFLGSLYPLANGDAFFFLQPPAEGGSSNLFTLTGGNYERTLDLIINKKKIKIIQTSTAYKIKKAYLANITTRITGDYQSFLEDSLKFSRVSFAPDEKNIFYTYDREGNNVVLRSTRNSVTAKYFIVDASGIETGGEMSFNLSWSDSFLYTIPCRYDPDMNGKRIGVALSAYDAPVPPEDDPTLSIWFTGIMIDGKKDLCYKKERKLCPDVNSYCETVDEYDRVMHQCKCKSGYRLEGGSCRMKQSRCGGDICSAQAECKLVSGAKRCVCRRGFSGDGMSCSADADDCRLLGSCAAGSSCQQESATKKFRCKVTGPDIDGSGEGASCNGQTCAANAVCTANRCRCKSGYLGDPLTSCYRPGDPGTRSCSYSEDCFRSDGSPGGQCKNGVCVCIPGTRDTVGVSEKGIFCKQCTIDDDIQCAAEPAGKCEFNETNQMMQCVCETGYSGDGFVCKKSSIASCSSDSDCPANAACREGRCACRSGYTGDASVECRPDGGGTTDERVRCERDGDCHNQAKCTVTGSGEQYCKCIPGYEGNGRECTRRVIDQCTSDVDCHEQAKCKSSPTGRRCVCKEGFKGDGLLKCERKGDQGGDRPAPCTDTAECHMRATCKNGRCVCEEGFKGNGKTECNQCRDDMQCHHNARCNKIEEEGTYLCECKPGFNGDGVKQCDGCEEDYECSSIDENSRCKRDERGSKSCVCSKGFTKIQSDPYAFTCKRQPLELMVTPTNKRMYEGQTVNFQCKVKSGPADATELTWSTSQTDGGVFRPETQATSSPTGDVRYLTITNLKLGDAGSYFCFVPRLGEEGRRVVTLEVLENPCPKCHIFAECNFEIGKCRCKRGYKGDGISSCVETTCLENRELCTSDQNCLHDPRRNRYVCKCKPGLIPRGEDQCDRPNRPDFCLEDSNCHKNAYCSYQNSERRCKCKVGYEGNGVDCQKSGLSCRYNSTRCTSNSTCSFTRSGYNCVCDSGYIGIGEKKCEKRIDCFGPNVCGTFSRCQQKSMKHRSINGQIQDIMQGVCSCQAKFRRIGNKCVHKDSLNAYAYVAYGTYLLKMPVVRQPNKPDSVFLSDNIMSGNGAEKTYVSSLITAVATDCNSGDIYWSSYDRKKIFKVSSKVGVPTSDQWVTMAEGITGIEGLAYDWQSGNLFYTANYIDPLTAENIGEIGVIKRKLDQNDKSKKRMINSRKVLFKGKKDNIVMPRAIVAHPNGYIMWTDWDRKSPRIVEANMDGTEKRVILDRLETLPNGLAIDFERNGDVCFAAASKLLCKFPNCTVQNYTAIHCFSPGMVNPRLESVYLSPTGQPFAIAAYKNNYFWTDWRKPVLFVFDRYTRNLATVKSPLQNNSRMYGVGIIPNSCPAFPISNPCAKDRNYGGCTFICLPARNGGRKCVCPDSKTNCFPTIKKDGLYFRRRQTSA